MSAAAEKSLPFIVAAVPAACAGAVFFCVIDVPPGASGLSISGMTFGVVVAGFAATQRNMLIGMGQSRILRQLAVSNYYQDVVSYLTLGVYAGLGTTVVSVFGFFVEGDTVAVSAWVVALVFMVSLVVALIARNEILSSRIVAHFMKEQAEEQK